MNTKQKIKLYTLAAIIGAGLAFEVTRAPGIVRVDAKETVKVAAYVTVVPTATNTPSPTPTPSYNYEAIKVYYFNNYGKDTKRDGYIDYIWNKWAGHGVQRQVEALCTNFAEGHFTDEATNDNGENGIDRGCWQWNSKYNPGVTDEQARNCFTATDLAYDKWVSRGYSFEGYWYGYKDVYGNYSDSYLRCLDIIN